MPRKVTKTSISISYRFPDYFFGECLAPDAFTGKNELVLLG